MSAPSRCRHGTFSYPKCIHRWQGAAHWTLYQKGAFRANSHRYGWSFDRACGILGLVQQIGICGDDEMIRKYVDSDIDAVMQIWLNTNIQAHSFISPDYWKNNFDVVKEMLPLAEIYVHEIDSANRIDGFIGLNDDYIEGIFVKEEAQSKGIGKQLLDHVKKVKSTLRLNVYQKNKQAIQFYLREEFGIQSESLDRNTGEKEFIMIWKR